MLPESTAYSDDCQTYSRANAVCRPPVRRYTQTVKPRGMLYGPHRAPVLHLYAISSERLMCYERNKVADSQTRFPERL